VLTHESRQPLPWLIFDVGQKMKLGNDDNFLEIIEAPNAGMPGIYAVRARVSDSLSDLSVRNDAIVFDSSPTTRENLAIFAALKSSSCALPTGGGGSITLTRDRRGTITVGYRIPSWEADAILEGRVLVDGEFSMTLLRDFKALIER
jgi:hypothetical protein